MGASSIVRREFTVRPARAHVTRSAPDRPSVEACCFAGALCNAGPIVEFDRQAGETRPMRSLGCLLLLVFVGCRTAISATEYQQTCATDEECVAVVNAELCAPCPSCPTSFGAINRVALAQYQKDSTTIRTNCPPRLGPPPPCARPPECTPGPGSVCSLGRCEVR